MDQQIRAHLETLDAAPGDVDAFEALERHYRQGGRFEELAALYEGRARILPVTEAAPLLLRAAEVARVEAKAPARAEELYRAVLSVEPGHVAALDALVALAEAQQDWPGLAAALERCTQSKRPAAELAQLQLRLGRLYEDRIGRRDRAALRYADAVRADPASPEPLERGLQTCLALRRFAQAKRLLDTARDAGAPRGPLAAAYARLGGVLVGQALFHDLAMDALIEAQALDRSAPGAAAARERLAYLPRHWREEVSALGEQAAHASRRDGADLLLRAAQLRAAYDQEGLASALELLERAWSYAPGHPAVLELIERVLEERKDFGGHAAALDRLVSATRDRGALVQVHLAEARLRLVRLGDPAGALAALERALQLDPACEPAALQAFEQQLEAGKYADAVSGLERHLEAAPSKPGHAPLRVRAAELARTRLSDPARARRHLEAALRADPGHAPAAAALAPLLSEAGEWSRLAGLLALRLTAEPDLAERIKLLERLAAVDLEHLDRPRDGFRWLARALALEPRRSSIRAALEEAARRARLLPELCRAMRVAADAARADPAARKPLLRRTAELLDRDLGLPEAAAATWRELATLDPADREAASAAASCAERSRAQQGEVARLEEALARAAAPDRRAATMELARHLTSIGRVAAAVMRWRELALQAPDDTEVLWGLHGALEASPGPAAAAERIELLNRLSRQSRGAAERIELELERASILAETLGRPGEAAGVVATVLSQGGTTAPQQQRAVGLLERLLERGVDPLRIARVLAPVHASRNEPEKQVAMLELMARRLPPDGDARERARHLLDAATIRAERLGDPRGALTSAAAALRACPEHAEARRRCEELAHQVGAQAELYALLVEAADRLVGRREDELLLRRRAAAVAEEELGAFEDAAAQLRRCLDLEPQDGTLQATLTRVSISAEHWEAAADLLVVRANRTTGTEQLALLGQLAEILAERMHNPRAAAEVYREALAKDVSAARPRLLSRLAGALGAAGDGKGQAEALAELATATEDPAEAARASKESARLAVGLGDSVAAAERLTRTLQADPNDGGAASALELLLDDTEPRVVVMAARALATSHATRGDLTGRLRALIAEARVTPDADERASAWREVARIQEQRSAPTEALAAVVEAARARPSDPELRRELRRVADLANDGEAAARVLQELVDALGPAERAPVLRELADYCERRLEERGRAVAVWGRLLEAFPGDPAALASLRRLHRADESWGALVLVCEQIAAQASSPTARQDALREIATTAEARLQEPARALEAWRQVAALAPDDRDVAASVERLLTSLQRHAELGALLAKRLERGFDAETAFRLAELRRLKLDDPAGSLALHAELARREPARSGPREALALLSALPGPVGRQALDTIDASLRVAKDQARRLALREARLLVVEDPAERSALHAEVRSLLENELADPARALAAARRAFDEGGPVRADAELDLVRLARANGVAAQVAEAWEAAAAQGGAEALGWRRRAATFREAELQDGPGAIAGWRAVLEALPEDADALEALERLHAAAAEVREQLDMALRRATLATGEARVPALRHAAEIARQAGDVEAELSSLAEARLLAPREPAVLAAQEEALGRAGRSAAQAETLRVLAEVVGENDPADRLALLLRRAALLEQDADPRRPVEAYSELLSEWPREAEAVAGLERLLDRPDARAEAGRVLEDVQRLSGDPARLAAVLQVRLDAAPASQRGALLAEIASLRERAGDRRGAFALRLQLFSEAAAAGHDDQAARADLERLASDTEAWEAVAGAYEVALGQVGAEDGLELRRRLASLCGDRLGSLDRAVAWWEEVAAADHGVEPLTALVRVRRRQGARRELVAAMLRLAEATAAPEAKKELLFEVAKIMDEQLANREGAIEAYRKILAIDPEDPGALRLLGRLLGVAERWDELVKVMEREALAASRRTDAVAEAAELRFRLGRIRQSRLADAPGALAEYRQVLERAPRHPGTLGALQELARTSGPAALEAALTLEPIFAAENEHAKVIEVLESRVVNEPAPAARAGLLRRIAELYGTQLRNGELAYMAASRSLAADPDSLDSLALAVRFGLAVGLPDELAGLLAENADRASDPSARVEYQRQLARQEKDPVRAAEAWQRLLEIAPEDREASAGLLSTMRGTADAEGLDKALRRALALEERPEPRARLLGDLAALQEERLGDPAGAALTLKRLLELAPTDREAMARLDRLYVASERWVELGDLLGRELSAARQAGDAAAVLGFCQRLGELKETRLLDRDGAMDLYEEVLASRPDQLDALGRLAGMLEKDRTNARAAQLLEAAYAATGDHARQAAALEARAGERPDRQERKALWIQLADLRQEKLADPDMAFLALCRAVREDPADDALRARLEALAEEGGKHEELAALYEDEVERLPPQPMAAVSLVLGRLYDSVLGGPAEAASWYRRARSLDPSTAAVALPALERLTQRLERWVELAEVLTAEASLTVAGEKVQLLFRLGQLCEERLAAPDQAAWAYEQALEVDARHLPSLQALEALYEKAGRQEDLWRNLAAQRDAVTDLAAKERLLAKQAALSATLGRPEESVELWRELLALRPRNEEALAALEELLQGLERWGELAAHLRVRIAATVDRREVTRLNDKLGWLLGGKLGDPAQAIQSYKSVLDLDPKSRRALEALRDIYAAQGDLEALASTLRRLVPLQEDPQLVKKARLDLAEVLLRAGQKQEAIEQGKRAFDIEPHAAEELVRIEEVFRTAGAGAEGVRAAEARAALLEARGGPLEAVPAWLAVADLWRVQKRPDAAAAALEKVLGLDSANAVAYQQLRELYSTAGEWRAYARVSDIYAPAITDPAAKLALLKEIAAIHEKRLGQKDMAFLSWSRALSSAPGDDEALAEVCRVARESDALDELGGVLEQVADESRGMVRAKLLLRLASLRDVSFDDVEGAETAIRRALEADPSSPEAIDALTDLFKRRGKVRELVIALEQKLEAAAGLDEKKALLLEVSRLYDEVLQDVDEAVTSLKRILELDGGDGQAIAALAALFRREHRWGELVAVLARARDLAADEAARIGWQLQIASVHEAELGDDEAAVEDYRTVLGVDERNAEALAGLERLYTKLDRFAELNRTYEQQALFSADPAEQVRILSKSAGIFEEKMHDPARATAQNEAILGIDGGNLPAITALERLYRAQGLFDRLLTVMQHHLQLLTDRREQVALMVGIGEVWWKEMSRVDRAEAIFGQALAADPESREAVSALARLYERSGNWNLALDMLQREARLAGASPDAVSVYARIGAIHEDMLLDLASAKEAYGKALALDPGHLPAVRAMKGIHEREGNRDGYLDLLTAEARYAEDDEKQATLWTAVGKLYQEERDDREAAVRAFEEALKRQPEYLPAAQPLSDLYIGQQRWPDAARVLEVMVHTLGGGGDAKELCRQCYRQGYVAEKLGDRQKALGSYRRAYEIDSTYLPALEGLGNLLVAEGQLEEALRIFTAIIIHHRDALSDLEVVAAHWQIGEIAAQLQQPDRAIGSYKKALEIDQGHEPSRRGLIKLLEAAGDWEGAVDQRQRLLPLQEGRAKFETLAAIGQACRDHLQDPYQAIDAFLAASRVDPTDLPATEALLALYRETRQGQKAADVLAGIIARPEVQADPPRASKLHLLLAEILRDEVKDENGAMAQYERALDLNPRLPAAFAAIEETLARGRRWPELEQAYLRMVQRLPKTPEAAQARLALWKTLGELYRNVLKSDEGARLAYQVVSRADPEDAVSLEFYADISARTPGQEGEAIQSYRQLVRISANPQKALSALVGLHAARKEYDRAYSAAQVLAHLVGGATAEEVAVVGRLRKYARDQATRPLDDKAWERLLHERLRGPLAEIMTLLAAYARPMFVQTPKELGVNPKKEELDVQTSMLFLVNMFKYVARTLGVEPLRLFRREAVASHLQLVPTDPPGVLVAEDYFRDRPKKELWFALGKALAFRRPELYMARLMPHDQLDTVFQATCSVGTSKFVVTADPQLVAKLKTELEKVLPEKVRTNTLKVLARQYTEVQHPGDVRAYLDGAELTSNRAGALLAGDLEIVRRGLLAEKAQVSKLRDETRLKDLSNFCVSEDYSALREQLGLAAIIPA